MYCQHGTVTNTKGDALPGYFVECVNAAGVVQTIFSDASSTAIFAVSGVANRAQTDSRGNYTYYVADGEYSEKYYDTAGVYQFTVGTFSMVGAGAIAAAGAFAKTTNTTTLEQFGGGTAIANNQPAIQAAINYLASQGGSGTIALGAGTYTYRTTVHTTGLTGCGIVVPTGLHLKIIGAGKHTTTLKQLSVNGNSPNTDWQVVAGAVWRGMGILVAGLVAAPATRAAAAGITLSDLTLDGGVIYGASATAGQGGATYPANTATGQGWDITHKAVMGEGDKYTDHIRLYRVRLTGWGGEMTYQGGTDFHKELTAIDCDLDEGNGDGFNPCCELVNIQRCTITRVYQAFEGWTGRNGRMQLTVKDCFYTGPMQGGKPGAGTYSAYYAPTRYEATKSPIGTFDLVAINSGIFWHGSFLKSTVTLFDTPCQFGGSTVFDDGVQDIDCTAAYYVDKASIADPFQIVCGGGPQLTKNLRLRLSVARTKAAVTGGFAASYPVRWGGSLGPNIIIESANFDAISVPGSSIATPNYCPVFFDCKVTGIGANATQNVETTPALIAAAPLLYLLCTTPGTIACTLQETNAQPEQMLELRNPSNNAAFVVTTSTYASVARVITIPPYGVMQLRFSGGSFRVVTRPWKVSVTAAVTTGAIAANATTAEQSMAVLGAAVGMPVTVIPATGVAAVNEVVGAYVSATGTVKFRLRDTSGAGNTPGTQNYTALVGEQ